MLFVLIYTQNINTLCGQNVEFLEVKLAVRKVISGCIGLNTPNDGGKGLPKHIEHTCSC